ncbi:hypothetical protein, partial [Klebsiella pneumoniae]|uniref:hypothetical protein n=1 Tax=Klebsiella pneumoniae TaxID=573 RepID=UPI0019544EF2
MVEVERELQALGPEVGDGAAAETADERAERQQIAAARAAIGQQRDLQTTHSGAALARLDQALGSLPPAFDEQQVAQAARA